MSLVENLETKLAALTNELKEYETRAAKRFKPFRPNETRKQIVRELNNLKSDQSLETIINKLTEDTQKIPAKGLFKSELYQILTHYIQQLTQLGIQSVTELSQQNTTLNQQLTEQTQKTSNLEEQIEKLHQEKEQKVQETIKQKDQEINVAVDQEATVQENAKKKLDQKIIEIKNLEKEKFELQKKVLQLESNLVTTQQTLEKTKQANQELEMIKIPLNTKELHFQVKQLKETAKKKDETITHYTKTVMESNQKIKEHEKSIKEKDEEILKLKDKLQQSNKLLETLTKFVFKVFGFFSASEKVDHNATKMAAQQANKQLDLKLDENTLNESKLKKSPSTLFSTTSLNSSKEIPQASTTVFKTTNQ